jgi:hypothetical protein
MCFSNSHFWVILPDICVKFRCKSAFFPLPIGHRRCHPESIGFYCFILKPLGVFCLSIFSSRVYDLFLLAACIPVFINALCLYSALPCCQSVPSNTMIVFETLNCSLTSMFRWSSLQYPVKVVQISIVLLPFYVLCYTITFL